MVILRRLVTIVMVCLTALCCLWLAGGPAMDHFSEPFILILVLGTTLLLGSFTYRYEALRGIFRNLFFRGKQEKDSAYRRITSQLALYGLISGILLAVVQILYRLGPGKGAFTEASRYETLRVPLVTLFYGVLTALGFWVVSGVDHRSPEAEASRGQASSERNQMILAFCVLLMAVGVLSLLIIGMNLDLPAGNPPTDSHFMEVVFGLKQGDDMVWRPAKQAVPNVEEAPGSQAVSSFRADESSPGKPSLQSQEPPLRWEPTLSSNVQNPPHGMTRSSADPKPQ